jgi:hypothetical protein
VPGKPVAPAEYNAMFAAYLHGLSFSEIGKGFKRNRSTVQRIAHRDKWPQKRAASRQRAMRKTQSTVEDELAEILKIQRNLRNAIWNKIAKRLGKDGKGPLGIPEAEEIQTLLQTMRDQLKTLGVDEGGGGPGIHSERTLVFLNLPEKKQREIEQKLLADLGMVDPAELDEAEIVEDEG